MALYNELPVYKASYDLLMSVFRISSNFSREYKYSVGESLKKDGVLLIKIIYRANSNVHKKEHLQQACETIEIIQLQFRLMHDMKQISLKSFIAISQQIDEVAKQLRGWLKKQ